jgi:hypothetical protein
MESQIKQAMANYQNAATIYKLGDYISLCGTNDAVKALKVVEQYKKEYERLYSHATKLDPELIKKMGVLKIGLSVLAAMLLFASSAFAECPPDVEGCPGNCCIETDK